MLHAQAHSQTGTTNRTGLFSRRLSRFFALLCALILAISFQIGTSFASRNSIEVKDNDFTVGITFDNSGVTSICSGTLISPTFILTAGHCVINENSEWHTNFKFTPPGKSLETPIDLATAPKVKKIYVPNDFDGKEGNEINDLAFIQLDKPLAQQGWLRIATKAELDKIVNNQPVEVYGYGYVFETGAPYSVFPRKYFVSWNNPPTNEYMNILSSAQSSACAGDSGGPVTARLPDGRQILIGNMHSAANIVDKCGTQDSQGLFHMQITIATKYLPLVESELAKSYSLVATNRETPAATPKKITYKITCLKVKTKKYVTGTNPKCPTGYKQIAKIRIS